MAKLYIEEMSKEQLTKVFNANSELQAKVLDDMLDSELYWIGEQLDYVRKYLGNWYVGTGSTIFLRVNDNEGFIKGLIEMDENIPLFSDKDKHVIYDTAEVAEKFFNMNEPYEEDYETKEELEEADTEYTNAEEAYNKAMDDLIEAVENQFSKILNYCYDHEAQLSYFLEFYRTERMEDDTFYIDTEEKNTLELFEDVAYTKSYK